MSLQYCLLSFCIFYFTARATTEIYTLSLHDALPIFVVGISLGERLHARGAVRGAPVADQIGRQAHPGRRDRKSTRLNSSHVRISYAVFCLKKKKNKFVIVSRIRQPIRLIRMRRRGAL